MSATGGCATAITGMAEAGRRRPGDLRAAVLRALRDAGRPLSALELRERIRGEGQPVAPSLVFRAIRELAERGAIRKVLSARGYIPGGGGAGVALYCRECGRVTEAACDEAFASLDRAAACRGFAVSRHIVEVPGVCDACAKRSGSHKS